MTIDKALSDLGVGINLMPYFLFQKLEMGKLSPTNIQLELVDGLNNQKVQWRMDLSMSRIFFFEWIL